MLETRPRQTAAEIGFAADRDVVHGALQTFCDQWLTNVDSAVADTIRYSVLGEGKRLRAILLMEAYRACGGAADVRHLAASIEVVHAYSLIHDDLPCMDNDDMRRGRPTAHRVYGVAVATAAGLAMVPLAVRSAWHATKHLGLPDDVAAAIVRELMIASGAGGMIGGQLLDLQAEGLHLDVDALAHVHRLKTGALITAAVTLGARAALATPAQREALSRYGAAIGLAFQIADDVLDVTATTDQLGKTAGRDLELQKSTYPALLGIDGAVAKASTLIEHGCASLSDEGLLTPALDELAHFIVARRS